MSFVTLFDLVSAPFERYFSSLKLSRRHQSLKMARNTLKMSFFYVYACFLMETRIRTQVAIYNSRVRLKYATFCIATRIYLLVYATVVSATRVHLLKMSKKYIFWNSSSLGSYATDSFSCNYFVFDPNSSLTI